MSSKDHLAASERGMAEMGGSEVSSKRIFSGLEKKSAGKKCCHKSGPHSSVIPLVTLGGV